MSNSIYALCRAFSYDPETGRFFWRNREGFCPQEGAMTAGKEAFISRKPNGYIYARLMGRAIYAHRAAWAISYGEWPKGDIDHINGDRADNRIANLRSPAPAVTWTVRGPRRFTDPAKTRSPG